MDEWFTYYKVDQDIISWIDDIIHIWVDQMHRFTKHHPNLKNPYLCSTKCYEDAVLTWKCPKMFQQCLSMSDQLQTSENRFNAINNIE